MKKYNIVLEQHEYTKIKKLLKDNNITFEPSSYSKYIYLDIIASDEEAKAINKAIKTLLN